MSSGGDRTEAYEIVEHSYDVVIVGAGGRKLSRTEAHLVFGGKSRALFIPVRAEEKHDDRGRKVGKGRAHALPGRCFPLQPSLR